MAEPDVAEGTGNAAGHPVSWCTVTSSCLSRPAPSVSLKSTCRCWKGCTAHGRPPFAICFVYSSLQTSAMQMADQASISGLQSLKLSLCVPPGVARSDNFENLGVSPSPRRPLHVLKLYCLCVYLSGTYELILITCVPPREDLSAFCDSSIL